MVIYGSVPVSDYFEHLHKKKNKIVLVHVIELPDMAHAREYSWAIGENKSEGERGETSLLARRYGSGSSSCSTRHGLHEGLAKPICFIPHCLRVDDRRFT